jgi:histidine phosphotransferase ChpT
MIPHAPALEPSAAAPPELDAQRFGALVGSRICHDLISPVGAVGNGVELIEEVGPANAEEELQLVARAAGAASAQLQFLRLAFGAAQAEEAMGWAALRRTALAWAETQRAGLAWPETGGETTRAEARLLCNLLQSAVSALPRGGEIGVEAGPAGLAATARGEGAALSAEAAAWLAGAPAAAAPGPRDIHHLAAAAHAAALGRRVEVAQEPGRVRLACPPTG